MSNYQALLARKRELDQAIEKTRHAESKAALATIHELIATFGFTAQQVFPYQAPVSKKAAPKYYDASTGQSWSGRGKPPKWIEGKDRTQFEIAPAVKPVVIDTSHNDPSNPFPIQ